MPFDHRTHVLHCYHDTIGEMKGFDLETQKKT